MVRVQAWAWVWVWWCGGAVVRGCGGAGVGGLDTARPELHRPM